MRNYIENKRVVTPIFFTLVPKRERLKIDWFRFKILMEWNIWRTGETSLIKRYGMWRLISTVIKHLAQMVYEFRGVPLYKDVRNVQNQMRVF